MLNNQAVHSCSNPIEQDWFFLIFGIICCGNRLLAAKLFLAIMTSALCVLGSLHNFAFGYAANVKVSQDM